MSKQYFSIQKQKNQYNKNNKSNQKVDIMKKSSQEHNQISTRGWIELFSLVLVLSLVTALMLFTRLDERVSEIKVDKEAVMEVFFTSEISGIIGLDEIKTQGDVYENSLYWDYIDTNGEINVFDELFKVGD